jgi:hypothetical protein
VSVSETLYAPAISTPQELERARTQTVELEIRRGAERVAPDSGTYTLFSIAQGSDAAAAGKVIDAQIVTVPSGVPTFVVQASSIPATLGLGEGYREEWRLTFGTVVETFERPAALIRKKLRPVISDQDLESRYVELARIKTRGVYAGSWSRFIDEAWTQIRQRLLDEGWLPYLIRTPQSLRNLHVHLTLHLMFMDFYTGLDRGEKYLELADRHRDAYESAWGKAQFGEDLDHDGAQDDEDKLAAAKRPIYPNATGHTRYFSSFGLRGRR